MQQVLSFVALGGFDGGRMAGRRVVGARMERVRTIQLMSVLRVLNKPNGYQGYCDRLDDTQARGHGIFGATRMAVCVSSICLIIGVKSTS